MLLFIFLHAIFVAGSTLKKETRANERMQIDTVDYIALVYIA